MNKKEHILITGIAGFIGSNYATLLIKQGHTIIGVDNLNAVYWPAKKKHNIQKLEALAKEYKTDFHFFHCDIREQNKIDALLKEHPVTCIIALAALAGVQPSLQNPQLYMDVNVQGTISLLEAARNNHIKNFVFASSSSVYGGNEHIPFSESDAVNLPISPYAASKRAGELICYTYHHLYQMSITCLRFFTVYGPNQRPDLAIYKFCKAITQGQKITLYGDGTSKRDYTFIDDITQGIDLSRQWVSQATKPVYDIFNLGENQMTTLKDLVKLIEKFLKREATKEFAPYLPGDVYATCANLEHSKKVLGYRPTTAIGDGLRLFCEWFIQEEQHKNWEKE